MPFQRLKFPASNRTAVVGATPAGTEADEDEAMAPTTVESWREDVIAAVAERTRGGRWIGSCSGGGGGSRRLRL
jgi:hypothetical protein